MCSLALCLAVYSAAFPAQNQFYGREILQATVWFTQIFRFDYICLFSPNLNVTVLYLPVGLLRWMRKCFSELAMSYLVSLLIG